jgi:hypothetical protein
VGSVEQQQRREYLIKKGGTKRFKSPLVTGDRNRYSVIKVQSKKVINEPQDKARYARVG